MKTNLKIFIALLAVFFIVDATEAKGSKKGTEEWRYDIECAGIGSEGTYLVKVWSYGKKPKVSSEEMKKNAVHGVLFRGFSGEQGCTSQRPLIKSPAVLQEKAEFFDLFFGDQGTYLKYANVVSPTSETIKVNKNEYKVGVIISISKDLLRKDMEDAGIIKGLSSGF